MFLLALAYASQLPAAVISRTITIDGDISDWTNEPDITTNPGQFSLDGDGSTCPDSDDRDAWSGGDVGSGTCDGIQSVGRDLRSFAFTYDDNNIYLLVTRFDSSTNITDWWFYIDVNNNGVMETSDLLFRVNWQGSNQTTNREIWAYTPATPEGDLLVNPNPPGTADGYDMPGTISNRQILSSTTGGSATGLEMETFIPWSTICGIGCEPQSVSFHISSSNGTNLPDNVADNMDGPGSGEGGGGAIVILDLSVTKTASISQIVGGGGNFTYTITVANEGGGDATGVSITDLLPAGINYISDDATSTGTTYDEVTGLWDIVALADSDSVTLNLTVLPDVVESDTMIGNTADSLTLNESDTDSGNNSDSVDVLITPSPDLTISKSHTGDFTVGLNESYLIEVTNAGAGDHPGTLTVTDTLATGLTYVSGTGLNWNCSASGQDVTCAYPEPLLSSDTTPALTLTVNVGAGAIGSFSNVAAVTAADFEDNTANNEASDPTTVVAAGNLMCLAVSDDAATLGLYEIDTGTFSSTGSVATSTGGITQIAYNCANGKLYGIRAGNQFGLINEATGNFTDIGTGITGVTTVTGLSYDAVTGGLYGVRNPGGGNDHWFQMDVTTGDLVPDAFGEGNDFLQIKVPNALDLAFDSVTGELLVIDDGGGSFSNDQIVSVDTSNGSGTDRANDLAPVTDMIGLASDNAGTGALLGADSTNGIYFIDNTGAIGASGNITGISNTYGFDCKFGCSARLLDIAVAKTVDDSTPLVGDSVTFTLTVTNNGPAPATTLKIEDVLHPDLVFDSASPSTGTFDEATGLWWIGTLANGGSATLTITVEVSGPVNVPIDNTASLLFVTQLDTDSNNNSTTIQVTPVQSNLSTSTKTVVDLNGGQPNLGDKLRYTINLIESEGTPASGVTVIDQTPPFTSALTVVSIPAGATDVSGVNANDLEITDINVPAFGTEQVVFDVSIGASEEAGSVISNTVQITNGNGVSPAPDPAAPDVTIVKNAETKILYAGPVGGESLGGVDFPTTALGRIAFTSTTGVSIDGGGASQTFTQHPPFYSAVTLDGTTSPGGVSFTFELVLSRATAGPNRTVDVQLGYQASCAGGITPIGNSGDTTVLSGETGPTAYTLSFNLTGDVTVPTDACMTMTVTNNTTQASRNILVHPTAAGEHSRVILPVFNFINVDSVSFHNTLSDAQNGTAPLNGMDYGEDLYLRSVVSDPFGDYDITDVEMTLRDPNSDLIFAELDLITNSEYLPVTDDTRLFINGPITRDDQVAAGAAPGIWDAFVQATEGLEGLVEDIDVGSLTVTLKLANLEVNRSTFNELDDPITETASGAIIRYVIEVTNTGPGKAYNVDLEDSISNLSAIDIDGITFSPGTTSLSIATETYYDDTLTPISPLVSGGDGAAAGYDGRVAEWFLTFDGVMGVGETYSVTYDVIVD
ncbi:MAG: hypothetical protein WD002_15835 [Pseudomonadales bacterium]